MALFLYGNLCRKIAIIISYSYQLNLVAPPNKIFGLQEAARENIKQEEIKVLSICPNSKIFSLQEDITRHVYWQFLSSPIHIDSADVFVQMTKQISLNFKLYLSLLPERQSSNTIYCVYHSHLQIYFRTYDVGVFKGFTFHVSL